MKYGYEFKENLYSDIDFNDLYERAFSEGYEYAQRLFFLDTNGGSYTPADVSRHASIDPSMHYNQSNWTKKNLSMADRVKAEKGMRHNWFPADTGAHTIKNEAQLAKAEAARAAKGGRFAKFGKALKIGMKMR